MQKDFEQMPVQDQLSSLTQQIQNIYIFMREKSREHTETQDSTTSSKFKKERSEIRGLAIFKVIEYIRAAIEILLTDEQVTLHSRKASIHSNISVPPCPEIYETLIQKLEADVRSHIRVQQQLKLHVENVEERYHCLET